MTDPAAVSLPDPADLIALLERGQGLCVLVVGDVMLDHFVYGTVDRISPEAPIPVLHVRRETRTLGGAGNVLRNLKALGAEVRFRSVVGADEAGSEVAGLVDRESAGPILVEPGRVTTVKTRYVAATQQILRADRETVAPPGAATRQEFLAAIEADLPACQAVILSDYAKGALADGIAEAVIALARTAGRLVLVDPKGRHYGRYRGAGVLKPNRHELAEATGLPVRTEAEVTSAARALIAEHAFGAVIVSLSQDGLLVVGPDGPPTRLPTEAREVFDVSGAGDTLIATLALALGAGGSLADAARLANTAAGIVVGKIGTATVEAAELADALAGQHSAAQSKALPRAAAAARLDAWRRQGLKVAFTNGCFDLLHPGHVSLLAQARATADRLVVGLNSDASVKRLKGPTRPVQNEAARATVLGSLASVDLVVVFDEDTPMQLLEALRPDVLVKGADYRIDQVVGADLVQSYGGRVVLADLSPGHSTTATIARMGAR